MKAGFWLCILLVVGGCSDSSPTLEGIWVPDISSTLAANQTQSSALEAVLRDRLSSLKISFESDGQFSLQRDGSTSSGTFEVPTEKNGQSILLIRGFGYTQRFTARVEGDLLFLTQGTDVIVMKRQ